MSNKIRKLIRDTFALKSRRYEFSEISTHTAVISRKTVKYAKKKISDTCALKSRRYEFSDISGHTVVITVKR